MNSRTYVPILFLLRVIVEKIMSEDINLDLEMLSAQGLAVSEHTVLLDDPIKIVLLEVNVSKLIGCKVSMKLSYLVY